ncbi:MAG: hypothetical protein Q9174_003814, partial [Haloplaca sp. 1 TL-2023]
MPSKVRPRTQGFLPHRVQEPFEDCSASNMSIMPGKGSGTQSHQQRQVVDHPADPNHQEFRNMETTKVLKENDTIRNRTPLKRSYDQQRKHNKTGQSPSPCKSNQEPCTKNRSTTAHEASSIAPALPNHDTTTKPTKNAARAALLAKKELYQQARREGLAIPDRSGLIPPTEPGDTEPVGNWDYSDGWKNPKIEDLRTTRTRGLFEDSPSNLPARDFKIYVAKTIHDPASGKEIVVRRIDPASQEHYPKLPSDPTRQELSKSNAKSASPPTWQKDHVQGTWAKRVSMNPLIVNETAATGSKVKVSATGSPSSSKPKLKDIVN